MLQKLKENVLILFSLSLIASYFACEGYYNYYNVNITSYLTLEDLTLIFAKWIWISMLLIFSIAYGLYLFLKPRILKRPWLIVVLILAAFTIPFFLTDISKSLPFLGDALIFIYLLIFTIGMIIATIYYIKKKEDGSSLRLDGLIGIITAIGLSTYALPTIAGFLLAKSSTPEKISVTLDSNEIIDTIDSSNLIYIGKTKEYFFISNPKTKATKAYRMDKVRSFEVITANQ